MKPALLILAAALALGACSSATPVPAPVTVTATVTTTVTASTTPKVGTSFQSMDTVRAALMNAGMPCPDWKASTLQTGSCSDLVLVTFMPRDATDDQRSLFMAAFNISWAAIQKSDQPVALLVGDNWMIRMHKDDAAIIQKAMGGIILTRP